MGGPRAGAVASHLAMVDSSKAVIPLRAMDSRTSATVAVQGVVEATIAKTGPL